MIVIIMIIMMITIIIIIIAIIMIIMRHLSVQLRNKNEEIRIYEFKYKKVDISDFRKIKNEKNQIKTRNRIGII